MCKTPADLEKSGGSVLDNYVQSVEDECEWSVYSQWRKCYPQSVHRKFTMKLWINQFPGCNFFFRISTTFLVESEV